MLKPSNVLQFLLNKNSRYSWRFGSGFSPGSDPVIILVRDEQLLLADTCAWGWRTARWAASTPVTRRRSLSPTCPRLANNKLHFKGFLNIIHETSLFILSGGKLKNVTEYQGTSNILLHFSSLRRLSPLAKILWTPLLLDVGPDHGGVGGPAGHGRQVPLLRRGPGNQP